VHSPEGNSGAEPNLIPLLDLVLQLLMLFIVCANFIQGEASAGVELPDSQSARPIEKGGTDVLILNLDADAKVTVLAREPMNLKETGFWLRDTYDFTKRNAKDGKVETTVIIRASKNVDYEKVFELMQLCKSTGYRSLNVRALSIGRDDS
jgi:biopolymer transport protein ExbD